MKNFDARWFFVGGWAIDLFLGTQTRAHSDVEIGIFRANQQALRTYLKDYEFNQVSEGVLIPWLESERLKLPVHEVYVQSIDNPANKLEVLFQEEIDGFWAFRRNMTVRVPVKDILLFTKDGIPFLSPEIILLYKTKNTRAKDQLDFTAVYDKLSSEQKCWLSSAIKGCQPEHEWLNHF
jgi:hypothetical protein